MKRILLIFLFIATIGIAHAQQPTTPLPPPLPANHADPDSATTITISSPDDKGKIFTAVEREAEFPGGLQAFLSYIITNLKIPHDAFIHGAVLVGFVIATDGHVIEPEIRKGVVNDIMKKEILRVFSESPLWKPGIQNSRPVRIHYDIPINFD